MNQDNTKGHKTICIDPAAFKDRLPVDDAEAHIFDEGDVLKFLIDELNAAGVDIAMIHHAHEHAIEYQGQRDYFSMGIASLDAPEGAVEDGMAELADLLNDYAGVESWTSYQHGKHCLHIAESEETAADEAGA